MRLGAYSLRGHGLRRLLAFTLLDIFSEEDLADAFFSCSPSLRLLTISVERG